MQKFSAKVALPGLKSYAAFSDSNWRAAAWWLEQPARMALSTLAKAPRQQLRPLRNTSSFAAFPAAYN